MYEVHSGTSFLRFQLDKPPVLIKYHAICQAKEPLVRLILSKIKHNSLYSLLLENWKDP